MKSLGGPGRSYLSPCNQRHKESKALWGSTEFAALSSKQEVAFLGLQKRVGTVGLSLAVSSQHKHAVVHSIDAANAQTSSETEEIQRANTEPLKNVHVRFKLTKECAFGQHFLIVGDDPILGLWDPSEGVPLNWSDGHVWTAELDVPTGKVIKYKFILKGDTETVTWQPGPDRILETWDTEKIITVCEDWDNPQLQIIVEEELVVDEESLTSPDLLVIAESSMEPIVEEGADVIEEPEDTNGHIRHIEKLSAPMVAENISVELGEQDLVVNDDQKKDEIILGNEGSNILSSKDENRLVLDEGVPILVPGSISVPPEISEDEEVNEVEKQNAENQALKLDEEEKQNLERQAVNLNEVENHRVESRAVKLNEVEKLNTEAGATELTEVENHNVGNEAVELTEEEKQNVESVLIKSDEAGELAKPKSEDEHALSASLNSTKTSEMMVDDEKQQHTYNKEQPKENNNSILGTNMRWGRRTLQRFLANFGLQ